MNNKEIALYTADVLDSKKALDITILDIAERSGFADYFVIATAINSRNMQTLCDEVERKLKDIDILVHNIEGKDSSGWVLMDYGDLIVNIFTAEQRDRYQIEKIWNDAIVVDYKQKQA